jgi:hypothetical protein
MKTMAGELHPVILQALAPHVRHLQPQPATLVQQHLTVNGVEIDCRFEFEPSEPRTWDEPGWPASYQLVGARVGGTDISALLSDDVVAQIEARAAAAD